MKVFLLWVIVLIFISVNKPIKAQEENQCLEPRFIPGQTVFIVGSVDAGGLPYRYDTNLDSPVQGIIPLGTKITTEEQKFVRCEDRRNWYEAIGWGWVMDGDGISYWLEPENLCSGGSMIINPYFSIGKLVEVDYLEETGDLLITVSNDELNVKHPILLDHYTLNISTGLLKQVPYRHAEIVTPELTDTLGITDRVFGINSTYNYSLYVSPDGSKIFYFLLAPESCVDECMSTTMNMYSADADGSNVVFIGPLTLFAFWDHIYWGANDRVYIEFVSAYGGGSTMLEVCLDGSCIYSLGATLQEAKVPSTVSIPSVSVSPDGKFIAAERAFADGGYPPSSTVIFNTEDQTWMELPSNGESSMPVIWDSNNRLYYPIDVTHEADEAWGFSSDGFAEVELDFKNRTFEVTERFYLRENHPEFGFFDRNWFHPANSGTFITSDFDSIKLYCIGRG